MMGLAGLLGALAVAMGAYAAHGLDAKYGGQAADRAALGAQYQAIHALCLFIVAFAACHMRRRKTMLLAGALFALGAMLFPGALYALAMGGPPEFAALAPVGGGALILGWLTLAWAGIEGQDYDHRAR
jgi:uncharacterized membrane protein YgdD (TMEM256/DUF423 family)